MQKLNYILKYIQYLRSGKNKYDIHPPFLYRFITEVFEDKTNYPEYKIIETLKKELLRVDQTIEVLDLGAGSSVDNKKSRSIKDITKYSSKPKKLGRLLFRISRDLKPSYIIELGTSMGLSSGYMALGNKYSRLTTIEGCPNIASRAALNFANMGIPNINLVVGDFDDTLKDCLSSIPQVDLVYIDGNHREEPTINYFEQCLLKTVNTSCMIFDDIHWSEGMENAWKYICDHESVTLSLDLFFMGIVFFQKELSKQHFQIRF